MPTQGLADIPSHRVSTTDHLHHAIWKVLVQQTPTWYFQCTRGVPEEDESNFGGPPSCLIDDIVVFGENQAQHDERLLAALERLCKARVTLNMEKGKFNQSSIDFLGHIISADGVRADTAKTSAIRDMPALQSLTELWGLLTNWASSSVELQN